MTRIQLAREIYRLSFNHSDTMFKLRSGKYSNEYYDKYLFESQPKILKAVAEHMLPRIPKDTDAIAGFEIGSIPIAVVLSQVSGIPTLFVRKEVKKYGTRKIVEGGNIANKRILAIEDIVTTGGQIISSVENMRKHGAIIHNVLCVIDREVKGEASLKAHRLTLSSLFTTFKLNLYNL